jgi:hypothetical protein
MLSDSVTAELHIVAAFLVLIGVGLRIEAAILTLRR